MRKRRLWKILGFGLLGLVVFALLIPVGVGILVSTSSGTRPQDRDLTSTPLSFGRAFRTVFFRSRDGVRISGWVLPASPDRDCSVVLGHGLFRSRHEVLERAAWLSRTGCHALVLDLRGHGASGRARTTLGYRERFDMLAGYDFMAREYRTRRRFLYGVSMGGAAAAGAALLATPGPGGVVLDSTFRNIPEIAGQYARVLFGLPPFPVADLALFGMRLAGGYVPANVDTEAFSRELGERGIPVLVIAGERDRPAPPAEQEAVFLANRSPDSRFLLVPGASHGRPCLEDPDGCRAALLAFFDPGEEQERQ